MGKKEFMSSVKIDFDKELVSYKFHTFGSKVSVLDSINDLIFSLKVLQEHVIENYYYGDDMPDLDVKLRGITMKVKGIPND